MKMVTYEIHEKTAIVTINNPPLNVMSKQVSTELFEVFTELEANQEAVAVILTGAGNKAFMAGADIKEFPDWIGQSGFKNIVMETHQVLNYLDDFPKPTIAVLNGLTFGGGCELAMTCDMRIAEEHAQLGLPEIKLGLFPGGGGTQRLPRLIGEAKAKEMMFTGEPISAEEADRYGLVNHVVPSGQGMTYAQGLASKITGQSLQALSRIKKAVNNGGHLPIESAVELEADLFEEVFQTEDIKEGVQAFMEKRKPAFTHR
ncbi:enoyl-CoA hydratase [Bacillus hwajinpoensis]|uniref:Enoyl-CoA hydratase n=1 Tax=Guptibacillus hwajinpoensis TaxID=208199 RepID=A0A845F0A6_9BACL|nr:enoyl-CoA hydratase [Pseudalkalibacillus hwajinpoensis]MYL64231.1 enoyl-CoA hydratase [Pseudalkalibacillus hwajinpoensis]